MEHINNKNCLVGGGEVCCRETELFKIDDYVSGQKFGHVCTYDCVFCNLSVIV